MEDLQKITTGINTVSFSYNEKYELSKFWLMLKTTFYTKTFSTILPPSEKQCEELCARVLISEIGNLVWILVICTSRIQFYI